VVWMGCSWAGWSWIPQALEHRRVWFGRLCGWPQRWEDCAKHCQRNEAI